jgi:uncharacterized protein YcnI
MDLKQLQDLGGFVPQQPVTKEVTWSRLGPDGEDVTDTFTVHVRKLSSGMIERLWAEAGKKPDQSYSARMIAATVLLGDDGTTELSYDEAFRLDPTLAEALLEDAVHPVNPLNRRKAVKN